MDLPIPVMLAGYRGEYVPRDPSLIGEIRRPDPALNRYAAPVKPRASRQCGFCGCTFKPDMETRRFCSKRCLFLSRNTGRGERPWNAGR